MFSVVLLNAALIGSVQSMCYKYEPLYSNWTGTTSLSTVKIPTDEICRKAAQCTLQQEASGATVKMCPLEILKPQPAPTISHGDDKKFYLNEFRSEILQFSEAEPFIHASEGRSPEHKEEKTAKTGKGPSVFTAMCFLHADWSNMCPRDHNVTNERSSASSSPTTPPMQQCYIMQRHTVAEDGICNITLSPKDVFGDLNGHKLADEISSTSHLMVFRIKPVDGKCFVSNSTAMTLAEIDRCFPEDEILANEASKVEEPTCELKSSHDNNTRFEYSLRSMFAQIKPLQCGPL